MKIIKKIILTLLFPVLMFTAMLIITASNPKCYVNGNFIFLGYDLVRFVVLNSCQTICVALAIYLQLKNGRFDFSTGAAMILAAIFAGNLGSMAGSPYVGFLVALVAAVVISCFTAVVYINGRLPIIISTIGVTLLYESLTYLVFGGTGISVFYQDTSLSIFGRMPGVFIPAVLAMIIFLVYDKKTVEGRRGKVLSNNQSSAVNIGIDERFNTLISYVFSGLIIGCAAIIYLSQNRVNVQSGLSTSGIMFSYIVSVYMGRFIGLASNDAIGISVSAISMSIMNYGLNCLNVGSGGWQQIIMGVFVMCFYAMSARIDDITGLFKRITKKQPTNT